MSTTERRLKALEDDMDVMRGAIGAAAALVIGVVDSALVEMFEHGDISAKTRDAIWARIRLDVQGATIARPELMPASFAIPSYRGSVAAPVTRDPPAERVRKPTLAMPRTKRD